MTIRQVRDSLLAGVVVGALTGTISLVWPKTYKSEAKILPNSPRSAASSLMGLAGSSGFGDLLSGQLGGRELPIFTYPEILTSRSMLERIALSGYSHSAGGVTVMSALGIKGAGRESLEKGVRKLKDVTRVDTNPRSGFLYVSAITPDSVLSAHIVERMLEELDRFNVETRSSRERATREFIGARMQDARKELALAEQTLTVFRRNNLRIGNSPQLELELGRLEREVSARSEVYRLLAREYEMARIEERRDTPTFSVVDPAKPPVRKYRPMVMMNVLIAFAGASALGMVASRLHFSSTR
jgi:uncharacterized protein involved in exopolysaccharide biosynthesis